MATCYLAETFCSPIYSLGMKPFRHLHRSQSHVFATSNFVIGKVPAANTLRWTLQQATARSTAVASIIFPSNICEPNYSKSGFAFLITSANGSVNTKELNTRQRDHLPRVVSPTGEADDDTVGPNFFSKFLEGCYFCNISLSWLCSRSQLAKY